MTHSRKALLLLGVAALLFPACRAGTKPHLGKRRQSVQLPIFGPRVDPVFPKPQVESEAPEELPASASLPAGEALSFEMRGMPLAQAIHLIAEAAGVNVYLDSNLGQVVDASFPSVTLDDALQVLLVRNGLRLVEDPPGIYWVERKDGSELVSEVFGLESVEAATIAENLRVLVGDQTRLVVDTNQNFVLARGPRRDLDLITTYVERADRLKYQVLIEVKIAEVLLDDAFELGLEHLIDGASAGGNDLYSVFSRLSQSGEAFSAVFEEPSSNLTTTLDALQEYGSVNLVSSPRVLVTSNSEALVEVTTEVPYIQATVTTAAGGGGAGSTTSSEEVEFKETGVKLRVTPVVQEGGVIQCSIFQELSEVVDFFSNIPVVDTRQLTTQMLVADGHTVVLGGLLQNVRSETDRGVPGLMDVPWVGRAFRSDQDSNSRRALMLFLRLQVVDPTRAAELAAKYEETYREELRGSGLDTEEASD